MKNYFIILILIIALGCSNGEEKEFQTENQTLIISNSESSRKVDCIFKTNMNQKCWTRIGGYPIDSIAEEFACRLSGNKKNNILVAKYIGDNGAFPNETAYVLWIESEKEYVKEFYTSGSLEVMEKPIRELNWKSLRIIADSLRIDTVLSRPQLNIMVSHNIGFAVQYTSQEIFFCERLQDNEWRSAMDKTHAKVIFWRKLTDLLKPTTDR